MFKFSFVPKVGILKKITAGSGLLLTLGLISILCMSTFVREGDDGALHRVQACASLVAVPFQFLGTSLAYAQDAASSAIENATATPSTLSALKAENADLKAQVAQLEEYRQEAIRLQELLKITDQYQIKGITGRVIGMSSSSWEDVVTLNVGSNAGISLGMPAVASAGLVGQVIELTPLTSKVRLLNDPRSGVAVALQGNRAQGVLKGSSDGLVYLEGLSPDITVNKGDVVVTSGTGGTYPEGIEVGVVSAIRNGDDGVSRKVLVSPFATQGPFMEMTLVSSMNTSGQTSSSNNTSSQTDSDSSSASS